MGFTLGGKTSQELGIEMLQDTQLPMLPQTEDRTLVIPGKNGKYDFGSDIGSRHFNLKCAIVSATTKTELQAVINNLVAHLTDANGRPRNLELLFAIEPEKKYTVRYSGQINIEQVVNFGFFTLPLVAFDPYSYAGMGVYDETRNYDTGIKYPNSTSMDWQYKRQTMSQYNYGNVETGPIITITGTCSRATLKNETTSGSITYAKTTVAGDVLVFDFGNLTAILNGSNVLGDTLGDFWNLAVGSNKLAFESDLEPDAIVNINFNNQFV